MSETENPRSRTKPKGRYYYPMPLDFMILGTLPEVGTIGGVHWKGRRVKDIVAELTERGVEGLDSTMISSRLKSMDAAGHVRIFPGSSQAKVWAKTKTGVSLQDQEGEYLNG